MQAHHNFAGIGRELCLGDWGVMCNGIGNHDRIEYCVRIGFHVWIGYDV